MKNLNLKKATSLTFNTIIVAILALIVLGVLIYLFINTITDSNDATSCLQKGGVCMAEEDETYNRALDDVECQISTDTCYVPG